MSGSLPLAIHRGRDDLPWVDIGDGSLLRVLHVDSEQGLWVVGNRFEPGYTLQTHKHTGPVYAFTTTGSWMYLEYPETTNTAGSYLFEPAGSIHTLHVPESNTETTDVTFAMWGSNLNLDAEGNVESVYDGQLTLDAYIAMAEDQGFATPDVILGRGVS